MDNLGSILKYNPLTGVWSWLVSLNSRIKVGQQAGTIFDGYRIITINGKRYRSARLAWFYMTGEWPPVKIDHIDTNRSNDKWDNLRLASALQNSYNCKVHWDNALGIKGVIFDRKSKRYRAQIWDKKSKFLGSFETVEEAKAVRNEVAKELHGEFFHE